MGKDYNIAKATGRCAACGKQMAAGEEFVATIVEAGEEFVREDFCNGCWDGGGREQPRRLFGVWHARVPESKEKKHLFVDDELLIDFFRRLDGADEPVKVQFRFVLALILMRKKLLVYERSRRSGDGRDVWTMRFKGSDETCQVVDPHLDDEKIAAVSRQLGEILEGEL